MTKPKQQPGPDGASVALSERGLRRADLSGRIAGIFLREGIGELGLRGLASRLGTSDRMLVYYFETKDQLVLEALDKVSDRLSAILAAHSNGPRVAAGEFLSGVLALSGDPQVRPFMRLWADVIARGARGEAPYDRVGDRLVQSWRAWICSRLTPPCDELEEARPAALLAIVEGLSLLELAAPGSTEGAGAYLVRMLKDA